MLITAGFWASSLNPDCEQHASQKCSGTRQVMSLKISIDQALIEMQMIFSIQNQRHFSVNIICKSMKLGITYSVHTSGCDHFSGISSM
jgi:hypothetical protein